MLKDEQYYELDEDIIQFFTEVEKGFAFAIDIKYQFQTNTKQKQMVKISKIADNYAVMLNANLLVTVNEKYYGDLDDEIRKILFEQELDKLEINFDKGTIKLTQPTLKTSFGLVNKHSYESIERAIETERLLVKGNKEE